MNKYKMTMHGSILKDLGINLYSSISSVISEVIANSFDADASKVEIYMCSEEKMIIVRDNGIGMTADEINDLFLSVGKSKRSKGHDNKTQIYKRNIMGRKGIGKLAPLAISAELDIISLKNNTVNGCRIVKRDLLDNEGVNPYEPKEISNEGITEFQWVIDEGHGTMLILRNVDKDIKRNQKSLRKMIAKHFPCMDNNFSVKVDGERVDVTDLNYFPKLEYVLDLSEERKYIALSTNATIKKSVFDDNLSNRYISNYIKMKLNGFTQKFYISGWIGCIKDLDHLKVINSDELGYTTDNRISIYARGKLGEYNILPLVKTNQGHDAYLIGEIHADFLEDSNFDDIAISSREGYIKSDPRYIGLIEYIKQVVRIIINERIKDKRNQSNKSIMQQIDKMKEKEKDFYQYINKIGEEINEKSRDTLIQKAVNITKTKVDKEILYGADSVLISHSSNNRVHADFVLSLLKIIGVPDERIIYTSSDCEEHTVPWGNDIFEYLRDEFRKDLYVCFVVEENFLESFACVSEAGAAWVTSKEYGLFIAGRVKFKDGIIYKPLNFSKIGADLRCLRAPNARSNLNSFKTCMVKRFNLPEPKDFLVQLDEIISDYYKKLYQYV